MSLNDQFDDALATIAAAGDVLATAQVPPADPIETLVSDYVTLRTLGLNEGRTPSSREDVLRNMAEALAPYPEALAKIDALGF